VVQLSLKYPLESILYDKACYLSEFGDLRFSTKFPRISVSCFYFSICVWTN